jgi:hypothetical protein
MRASLLHVLGDDIDPRKGIGDEMIVAIGRTPRSGDARPAPERHHCHISIGEARKRHTAMQCRLDLRPAFRRREPARFHRRGEPVEMVVKPEEAVPEDMHDVIDGIRTSEAPVGDRNVCFRDGQEAAANIGGAIGEGRCVHGETLEQVPPKLKTLAIRICSKILICRESFSTK